MMATQTPANSRSEKYKNAMKDVSEGGMSVREAASKWDVPKSSLHDRLSGKVEYDRRSGPPSILTKSEEVRLAEWLVERAQRGFGHTKDGLLDLVKKLVDKDKCTTPFKNNRPGNKWYRSFIARNANIRLRNARPLDKKRAKISAADLDEWFAGYEKFIHDHGLVNRPSQIWNCDESGFDLQGRAGKILGPSSTKEQPYRVVTGTREHITVLPCFNACGQWMAPYILFAGKRIPVTYNPLEGGVPGSVFSVTEKGYMDTPTFYMWFANHFIPQLPPPRPVVLLVDSHESHIDLDSFELAKKNGIHIFALLKNATHLVQPADVGLFGAMKQTWYKNVRIYSQNSPNTDITKKNFCSIFKSTWEEVMRPSILVDAFRKSGIFPICRAQISNDQVKSSLVYADPSSVTLPSSTASHSSPTATSCPLTVTTTSFSPTATPMVTEFSSAATPSSSTETSSSSTTAPFSTATTSSSLVTFSPSTESDLNVGKGPFDVLESTLQTPTKDKYRRRIEEGYDLPGSPVFNAWKELYALQKENQVPHTSQSLAKTQQHTTPMSSTQYRRSSSERVSPVLDEILVYPSAPDNTKKLKNNKVTIPNFMTSETSMKILLDQKLKKARSLLRNRRGLGKGKKKEKLRKK